MVWGSKVRVPHSNQIRLVWISHLAESADEKKKKKNPKKKKKKENRATDDDKVNDLNK